MRDDASVAAAVAEVTRAHQRIGLTIHAAGVSREGVVWKLSVEEWDLIHSVNLRGAFLLLRHTIPVMRQGAGGRVVLIGSINGSRGKFGTSAYSASKAGLLGLAKSVAREVGRFGILVNVLGKLLEPSDGAAAVLFLCGSGSSHVTGQILRVDGGQYLGAY